jgi:opacity protein-like surface antigen
MSLSNTKKTRLLLLFMISLCPFLIQAQPETIKPKIILGILGAQIDGDRLGGFDKPGLITGMAMEMKIAKRLSLQPEIVYNQKGARSNSKSLYFAIIRLSYINLNGSLNLYLRDNIALQGGLYYSILFRAKADVGGGFVDASKVYNKTDFGYLVGIDYRFTPKTSINLRLEYSLTSINEFVPQYNNVLLFSLRFMLGK